MQGPWVRSLVRELEAHVLWGNYAHAFQLLKSCTWSLRAAKKGPACSNQDLMQPNKYFKNSYIKLWFVLSSFLT